MSFIVLNGLGRSHLPEHLLLRDTLYLLQGISGKYVRFASKGESDSNNLVFVDDTVRVFLEDSPF